MYQGKKTKHRKHRKYEVGREAAETKIGKDKKKEVRTKGGNRKIKLLAGEYANVFLKNGKTAKRKIVTVVLNPGNKDFTRRNIITKGAILKVTDPEGKEKEMKVKVTSRPGQDGVINAIEEEG